MTAERRGQCPRHSFTHIQWAPQLPTQTSPLSCLQTRVLRGCVKGSPQREPDREPTAHICTPLPGHLLFSSPPAQPIHSFDQLWGGGHWSREGVLVGDVNPRSPCSWRPVAFGST